MNRADNSAKKVSTIAGLLMIAFALWFMVSTDSSFVQMLAALLMGFGVFVASYKFVILPILPGNVIAAEGSMARFLFLGATSFFVLVIAVAVLNQIGNILAYYILVAIGMSMLLLMISWTPEGQSRSRVTLVMLLISVYSLVLRGVVFFSYPSIVGVDPWVHAQIIEGIVQSGSGHIPVSIQGIYQSMPVFHVLTACGSILENVDVKTALFLNDGIPICLLPLWVYLILRSLSGIRLGLLAALLACCITDFIRWGWWIVPSALGLPIFLTLLYSYLPHRSVASRSNSVVFMLAGVVISWTHLVPTLSIVAVCALVLVTKRVLNSGLLGRTVDTHNLGTRYQPPGSWPKLMLLLIVVFGSLMVQTRLFRAFTGFAQELSEGTGYPAPPPIHQDVLITIWNRFPTILVIVLSAIGLLVLLRYRARNDSSGMSVPLAISGIFLGAVSMLSVFVTSYYPVDERVLPFSFLCLLGVAAIPIYLITHRIGSFPSITAIIALAVVTIAMFSMITNGLSNLDSPLPWVQTTKASLTDNEISVERFIMDVNAKACTDSYYFLLFNYSGYGNRTSVIDSSGSLGGDYADCIILLRQRSSFTNVTIEETWSLMLDSGQVRGYLITT
jgi:hypothetical protein